MRTKHANLVSDGVTLTRRIRTLRRQCLVRAFTLIEILVVVAIIALLVAVLLPALRLAREQAKRIACESNVRQLAQAWHLYLTDSKERFPRRAVNANVNYGGQQGQGAAVFQVPKPLNKYLHLAATTNNAKSFLCPCDRGITTFKPSCWEYVGTSYSMNNMLIGDGQLQALTSDPCNQPPRSLLSEINTRLSKLPADNDGNQSLCLNQITSDSSRLILLGDFGWWNAYYFTTDQDMAEWHVYPSSYNLAFLDGHADFIRVRKGLQVTAAYTVIPFKDLLALAAASQREVKP
jgi:prepilin-type N-terminal cleavage/methylation domain-containing protein